MNNNLKVVVFNAPMRLGKDSAAEHMVNLVNTEDTFYTAHQRAFKDSLFNLCAAMYGITVEEFLEGYDEPSDYVEGEWYKDSLQFFIDASLDRGKGFEYKRGYSQRSSLIHMSENIIKPVFGKDAFGKAMVASLPESGIVFVSDGGFAEELLPVIDHVGQENVLVVKIHRKGVDFAGDSRAYLDNKDLGDKPVCMVNINNDGSLEEFLGGVEYTVGEWLLC